MGLKDVAARSFSVCFQVDVVQRRRAVRRAEASGGVARGAGRLTREAKPRSSSIARGRVGVRTRLTRCGLRTLELSLLAGRLLGIWRNASTHARSRGQP